MAQEHEDTQNLVLEKYNYSNRKRINASSTCSRASLVVMFSTCVYYHR